MVEVEVLIVGAGPVGSIGAARLTSMGIDVMICEAQPTCAHDLRASTLHASTVEMLDEIDAAVPLIAKGLKAPVYNMRDRKTGDTLSFDLSEIADYTRFPFRLQCEQFYMAELLTDRMAATLPEKTLFSTRLVDAREEGDRVIARLERDGRVFEVSTKFLVGADGAHSRVRSLMGVGFEGFTYEEKFVSLSTAFPIEDHMSKLSYVNYISDPEEWLVLLRVPTLWRILVPAPGSKTDAQLISDENVAEVFSRIVGGHAVTTAHRTIYRVHQRVAEHFVKGRLIITGDAAHLNNPLGGFGMNSGIHDMWNLCERLWSILRHDGDADLLGLFERQRHQVTKDFIQRQTMENMQHMQGGGPNVQRRARMEAIHADPVQRRQYLLRQAMFESLRDAEKVQ